MHTAGGPLPELAGWLAGVPPTRCVPTVQSIQASSLLCPLHTAITQVSKVLEPRSSREFQWQLARETRSSNTLIT